MVNLNEEVYGQHKKDAHLTADMGSHLFSLFQALLPEQFDLSFIINICTAVKTKQMPFQALLPEQFDLAFIINICTAIKIKQMLFQALTPLNYLHCR